MLPPLTPQRAIARTVREEWGRILASLVKTLGDFQLAEDCLQDAVVSAMDHWTKNGLPNAPAAWLITTARRKAIDRLRRDANFASKQAELSYLLDLDNHGPHDEEPQVIPDKRLEMIFTCCHPALEEKTRIALTLRTLGGLTTDEIAAAFLDGHDAMAQRLVRAKKKIALSKIPYQIPDTADLPERLSSVASVIYLIFNEGYSASSGEDLLRADLCEEAIRLARIVRQLLPDETEIGGLLALMLLHDSRRIARTAPDGAMVSLEDQNRQRWDRSKIAEGAALLEEILPKGRIGPYQLQAAISAIHAQSETWDETDWGQMTAFYKLLHTMQPSGVVRINWAMAVSRAVSIEAAMEMLDAANGGGALDAYQHYHSARADLLARSGKTDGARESLQRAIDLSSNAQEKAFLNDKLEQLDV